MISSIRENVSSLPANRHEEIFADFAEAAKKRDINYLADTVLNWALGGHGYAHTGEPVNRLVPVIRATDDAETVEIWEQMWAGVNK